MQKVDRLSFAHGHDTKCSSLHCRGRGGQGHRPIGHLRWCGKCYKMDQHGVLGWVECRRGLGERVDFKEAFLEEIKGELRAEA